MKILEYKFTFLYFNCNIRKRKGRLAPPPCASWSPLSQSCWPSLRYVLLGVLGVFFGVLCVLLCAHAFLLVYLVFGLVYLAYLVYFGILGLLFGVFGFWFGVLLGVLGVFWRTLVYCVLGILVSIIGVFVIGILYLLHLEFELVYLMFSSLKTCIFMFVFPEEIC